MNHLGEIISLGVSLSLMALTPVIIIFPEVLI